MQLTAFEVLADPTRRGIVETLRDGECAVNDIVEAVAIHQSGVSRHLRILHENGFVDVRADGAQRFYVLRAEPFRELDGWLSGYRSLWEARLDRMGAALSRMQKSRSASSTSTPAKKAMAKKR